jgi:hypothetical protein
VVKIGRAVPELDVPVVVSVHVVSVVHDVVSDSVHVDVSVQEDVSSVQLDVVTSEPGVEPVSVITEDDPVGGAVADFSADWLGALLEAFEAVVVTDTLGPWTTVELESGSDAVVEVRVVTKGPAVLVDPWILFVSVALMESAVQMLEVPELSVNLTLPEAGCGDAEEDEVIPDTLEDTAAEDGPALISVKDRYVPERVVDSLVTAVKPDWLLNDEEKVVEIPGVIFGPVTPVRLEPLKVDVLEVVLRVSVVSPLEATVEAGTDVRNVDELLAPHAGSMHVVEEIDCVLCVLDDPDWLPDVTDSWAVVIAEMGAFPLIALELDRGLKFDPVEGEKLCVRNGVVYVEMTDIPGAILVAVGWVPGTLLSALCPVIVPGVKEDMPPNVAFGVDRAEVDMLRLPDEAVGFWTEVELLKGNGTAENVCETCDTTVADGLELGLADVSLVEPWLPSIDVLRRDCVELEILPGGNGASWDMADSDSVTDSMLVTDVCNGVIDDTEVNMVDSSEPLRELPLIVDTVKADWVVGLKVVLDSEAFKDVALTGPCAVGTLSESPLVGGLTDCVLLRKEDVPNVKLISDDATEFTVTLVCEDVELLAERVPRDGEMLVIDRPVVVLAVAEAGTIPADDVIPVPLTDVTNVPDCVSVFTDSVPDSIALESNGEEDTDDWDVGILWTLGLRLVGDVPLALLVTVIPPPAAGEVLLPEIEGEDPDGEMDRELSSVLAAVTPPIFELLELYAVPVGTVVVLSSGNGAEPCNIELDVIEPVKGLEIAEVGTSVWPLEVSKDCTVSGPVPVMKDSVAWIVVLFGIWKDVREPKASVVIEPPDPVVSGKPDVDELEFRRLLKVDKPGIKSELNPIVISGLLEPPTEGVISVFVNEAEFLFVMLSVVVALYSVLRMVVVDSLMMVSEVRVATWVADPAVLDVGNEGLSIDEEYTEKEVKLLILDSDELTEVPCWPGPPVADLVVLLKVVAGILSVLWLARLFIETDVSLVLSILEVGVGGSVEFGWSPDSVADPGVVIMPLEIKPVVELAVDVPLAVVIGSDADTCEPVADPLNDVKIITLDVTSMVVKGIVVTTEICEVLLANGALVLLYRFELWRAIVVDVRLPVAGMLVKIVAFPVVSDDEDEVVRLRAEVGENGVIVKLGRLLDEPDVPPIGLTEKVLFSKGNGGLLDDPTEEVVGK